MVFIRFSFSQCLRNAFFVGAGYGDLQKISEKDQRRWIEYAPPTVGAFISMESHFQASDKMLETLKWVRANYAAGSTEEINRRIDAAVTLAEGRTDGL